MKKPIFFAAVVAAVAFSFHASAGATRAPRIREAASIYSYPSTPLANGTGTGASVVAPDTSVRITGVSMWVVTASGGGAGNTVITITDGTNTCTATWTCVSTQATGVKRVIPVDGAGSGCVYPPNAAITTSVTTAGCTTTQPNARSMIFHAVPMS